jgi:hypothetical protein
MVELVVENRFLRYYFDTRDAKSREEDKIKVVCTLVNG